jgi:hypothetical protein
MRSMKSTHDRTSQLLRRPVMAHVGTRSALVFTALAGMAVGASISRTRAFRHGVDALGLYAYMTAVNRRPVDLRIAGQALKESNDFPPLVLYRGAATGATGMAREAREGSLASAAAKV